MAYNDIAYPPAPQAPMAPWSSAIVVPPIEWPEEPTPEPEPASIRVLRSLLEHRQSARASVAGNKKAREQEIEGLEKRLADLREQIADDEAHLRVVDEAIAEIKVDIAKL